MVWLAGPQQIDGTERQSGFIRWGGGTFYQLATRLAADGCRLQALWIPEDRIGYHAAAPQFVNQQFTDAYVGQDSPIAPNTELAVACTDGQTDAWARPMHPEFELVAMHLRWILSPHTNSTRNKQGTALVQFGGGSFQQLIGRLAIDGCNAHRLSIGELQYNFEHTNATNQPFRDAYFGNIERGTSVYVECVDNCDIIYGLDLVEYSQAWRDIIETCIVPHFPEELEVIRSDCATGAWTEETSLILTVMPLPQDICRINATWIQDYFQASVSSIYVFTNSNLMYQWSTAAVWLISPRQGQWADFWRNQTQARVLAAEAHELCHHHQEWQTFKFHMDHDFLKDGKSSSLWPDPGAPHVTYARGFWYETEMAQEFMDLVGYTRSKDGEWQLPASPHYRDLHSYVQNQPEELAAEICAAYLLRQFDPDNSVRMWLRQAPYWTQAFDDWVEKWIVLPMASEVDEE